MSAGNTSTSSIQEIRKQSQLISGWDEEENRQTHSPGLVQERRGIFGQRRLQGVQDWTGYPESFGQGSVSLNLSTHLVTVESFSVSTEAGQGDTSERDWLAALEISDLCSQILAQDSGGGDERGREQMRLLYKEKPFSLRRKFWVGGRLYKWLLPINFLSHTHEIYRSY